jgi:uncharacterized protein YndB with AHSA1/START domain
MNGEMSTIEAEILIDAPIEAVFEYVATPENHTDMNPNITEVTGVEELPNGGHEADFSFRMLGKTLHGHVRDIEIVPPERRVFDVEGDVDARTTYELSTEDGTTRFAFTNEVDPPSTGVFGRLLDSFLGWYLKRNAKSTMENTRLLLETRAADD